MLLRHFVHAQIAQAAKALLAQLALAKDADERERIAYEALQSACLIGYDVRDTIARDAQ